MHVSIINILKLNEKLEAIQDQEQKLKEKKKELEEREQKLKKWEESLKKQVKTQVDHIIVFFSLFT